MTLLLLVALSVFVSSANADPLGAGLKGLQVQMVDDALALGIKHAALMSASRH